MFPSIFSLSDYEFVTFIGAVVPRYSYLPLISLVMTSSRLTCLLFMSTRRLTWNFHYSALSNTSSSRRISNLTASSGFMLHFQHFLTCFSFSSTEVFLASSNYFVFEAVTGFLCMYTLTMSFRIHFHFRGIHTKV